MTCGDSPLLSLRFDAAGKWSLWSVLTAWAEWKVWFPPLSGCSPDCRRQSRHSLFLLFLPFMTLFNQKCHPRTNEQLCSQTRRPLCEERWLLHPPKMIHSSEIKQIMLPGKEEVGNIHLRWVKKHFYRRCKKKKIPVDNHSGSSSASKSLFLKQDNPFFNFQVFSVNFY